MNGYCRALKNHHEVVRAKQVKARGDIDLAPHQITGHDDFGLFLKSVPKMCSILQSQNCRIEQKNYLKKRLNVSAVAEHQLGFL